MNLAVLMCRGALESIDTYSRSNLANKHLIDSGILTVVLVHWRVSTSLENERYHEDWYTNEFML